MERLLVHWLQDQLDFCKRILNGEENVSSDDWRVRQRLKKWDELVDDFPQVLDVSSLSRSCESQNGTENVSEPEMMAAMDDGEIMMSADQHT